MIYHITTKCQWKKALTKGYYLNKSLHKDGFIHSCIQSQFEPLLKKFYVGQTNLIKLHIEESKLFSEFKYELSPTFNEMFPHIFGVINLDAVVHVEEIPSQAKIKVVKP